MQPHLIQVLHTIHTHLHETSIVWAITGSAAFAMRGMDFLVHDVDIQTDRDGAYAMEKQLALNMIQPVRFSEAFQIRSHFGVGRLGDVTVEIMGDIEKKDQDGRWHGPPTLPALVVHIPFHGIKMPVLSLEYECEAYRMLGRHKTVTILEDWIRRGHLH